jgi:hypothetical protein
MIFDDHGASLQPAKSGALIDLWVVDLKPGAVYQLSLEAATASGRWDLLLIDAETGAAIHQVSITEQTTAERMESLFKNGSETRIKLAVRSTGRKKTEPLRISSIGINEIPSP